MFSVENNDNYSNYFILTIFFRQYNICARARAVRSLSIHLCELTACSQFVRLV